MPIPPNVRSARSSAVWPNLGVIARFATSARRGSQTVEVSTRLSRRAGRHRPCLSLRRCRPMLPLRSSVRLVLSGL